MFQQTGSRGDGTKLGGTGAFDTDRFYLSDAMFKELFPTASNGELPDECPDDCKELIQAIKDVIEVTNHKVLNLEQQITLIMPLLDGIAGIANKNDGRITSVEVVLKAIAETIDQGV